MSLHAADAVRRRARGRAQVSAARNADSATGRTDGGTAMTQELVAPFPQFGGKRRIVDIVWPRLDPAVNTYPRTVRGVARDAGLPDDLLREYLGRIEGADRDLPFLVCALGADIRWSPRVNRTGTRTRVASRARRRVLSREMTKASSSFGGGSERPWCTMRRHFRCGASMNLHSSEFGSAVSWTVPLRSQWRQVEQFIRPS